MTTATEQNVAETIVNQIQPALARWYTGDPMGYADLFADDLTYFAPPTGGRLEGIEALKASYEYTRGDDAPSARWNATEVYRRHGDEWRIIHAHWSPR